jgi:parallel beta-helix repeat protein
MSTSTPYVKTNFFSTPSWKVLVLFIAACWLAPNMNAQVMRTLPAGGPFATLQAAIDDAGTIAGSVLSLTANLNEGLVTVNKAVTIDGAGFSLNSTSPNWGVNVDVPGISILNLTVDAAGTFGIITSCGADNLSISNTTVSNGGGSGFALNGSDNLSLTNITATNNLGNGVSITDCNNVTINGLTTSGNAFGGGFSAGVGIFASGTSCPPAGTSNVTITGTVSISEPVPVYEQITSGTITGISLPSSVATHFAGVALISKIYMANLANAYTAAASLIAAPSSVPATLVHVEEISTGNKYINDLIPPAPPQVGTYTLSFAAAINYAVAGVTVFVEVGLYAEKVTINKSLTLQGADEANCIIDGTGLGNGSGITLTNGTTNVTIQGFTIRNHAGAGPNSFAGIYATGGNNQLTVEDCTIHSNVGGSGVYANGPISNVTFDNLEIYGHTNVAGAARGIVIWNGLKSLISVTNCHVYNNNCCGIELQDGSASNVTMSNNNVHDNGDNGIGIVGLDGSVGPNSISGNTLTDNGRFGIEIKNPNGNTTVTGNIVTRTVPIGAEVRDLAGIAVFRRGVLGSNVDIPASVSVTGNTVSGYTQPSSSEGFGIVVEGINHTVSGNTVNGCDVAIQQQAGHTPYPGDGNQNNLADLYFGRGNSPQTCGNTISGNTFGGNGVDERSEPTSLASGGLVQNINTSKYFCSIQAAINDAQTLTGHTLEVSSGTYNEQVLVNKGVIIKGVGMTQPLVNFTGTVTGKPTLFDVSVDGVTIENIHFNVDMAKLRSAIIASGAGIDNITVKDNVIDNYGTAAGSYGDRNAVSINYFGSTNYRVASGGVNNVTFTGNTVNVGGAAAFRAGISADEVGGAFSGNTIQSINQDIQIRFGSNGDIDVSNNILNGGGVEIAEPNAGAGAITVSGNTFDGTFGNLFVTPRTAVLRLKNNQQNKATTVSGNTFLNHRFGLSLENYRNVSVLGNNFTPESGSTDFVHIGVNTKSISSNSNMIVQTTVDGSFTSNTFNASGTPGGTALGFYNHDNDNASFGTFSIGGLGLENTFNAGFGHFIRLDNQTGSSNGAFTPTTYPGTGSWPTTMACWNQDYIIEHNNFDVGSGPQLPSAMSLAERANLEVGLFHKPDAACTGQLTYFYPVHNLTQNTFYLTIQSAVNAANPNDIIECSEWLYSEKVTINKSLTLQGVDEANCIIDGTGLGNGSGITLTNGTTKVTIQGFTIRNHSGTGPNSFAGIYATGGNNQLTVEDCTIHSNVGGSGVYANGPISNVTFDNLEIYGHTNVAGAARGIVIWNGLKSLISVTNCHVYNNNCCGIELQDGSASSVTMSNNNVHDNGDNGIGIVGLDGSVGPNSISGNTLTDNGRFGIEIKNPNGNTSVTGNIVTRTVPIGAEVRDLAGIAVFRRGVLGTNVDIPTGVSVTGNTVTGYTQPSSSEGFGIVIEGINHTVSGNTVSSCDVAIQQQAGHTPYPGDGNQNNLADLYFGRGNSPQTCGNTISGNTFGGNGVDERSEPTSLASGGLVQNTNTSKYFCSIQAGIDDVTTLTSHTLAISTGTFTENVNATVLPKDISFAPGASPGCVTINGNFTLNAGDVLEMEANGNVACTDYDQFIVNGTVDLGGATLSQTLGFTLANNDQIVLIDNDGADAVIGQFVQGNFINIGGDDFYINYTGGTGNDVVLSRICADVCAGPITRVGNVTLSTQAQVNAFKDPSGCKYTVITGSLTLIGNDALDPIVNLCNLQELVSVGTTLTIREFTNALNPSNLNDLAKLESVGTNLTIGGSAGNQNTQFTVITLTALKAIGNSITITHNTAATNISIPTTFPAGINALTVQNNAGLNTLALGISTTLGNVTINTNNTGVTSISLPNLTSVGGNLSLSNNVANNTAADLGFPLLTTVTGSLNFTRTAKSINMPALASVGTTFTISSNSFDLATSIALTALTEVPGALTIDGNLNLQSINIPGPFPNPTASVSIETNDGIGSITLGVSSTTLDVAIQTNGTALTTVNLNQLTSVGRYLDMNNAAAHDVSATANVNLSALTTTAGRLRFVRSVNTLNIGNLISVGTDGALTATNRTFTFQRNAIADLDATFPAFQSIGGNLSVTNNTNLSQCCIIPCKLVVAGTTTVSANTGNCATLIIATAACAPTVSAFTLTEASGTADDGNVCNDGTDITLNATATTGSGTLNYEFFVDVNNDNLLDGGDISLYNGPLSSHTFSEAVLGGPGTYNVSVQVTVGGGCDAYPASNLTITVHDVPVANNAIIMVCSTDPGGSTADFTLSDADADVTGGAIGVTVTYHASQADADNNVAALSSPFNSDNTVLYARVENASATYCFATSEVTLMVKATPNAGSITSGERLICENGDPVGFTAMAVTGVTYQWQFSQDNGLTWSNATGGGGINSQNYNIPNGGVPNPEVNTRYRRQVTSIATGCTNTTSSVTVYVNTFDVGTILDGTPQTVCVGNPVDPIDATAPTTISGPGLVVTPTYQWQQSANGTSGWSNILGADQEDFTPTGLTATRYFRRIVNVGVDGSAIPTNPTTVSCSKTPASWQAVVFVNVINPGTINMASGSNQQTICEGGDPAVFNTPAATVPAGATRTYLWQYRAKGSMDPWVDAPLPNNVEDYNAPAGSITFDAEFQRIVYSELNGVTCEAITINSPTIDINEISDPGTITYAGDPDFSVCSGTTPLAFTGTLPDVDGVISYQWRSSITINTPPLTTNIAGGAGQDLPSPPAITSMTHYGRRVTSTLNGIGCSDYSNIITITVDPLPSSPTVTPSAAQSFCTDAVSVDINYTITIPVNGDKVEWSFDNFSTVAGSTMVSGPQLISVPAPTPNPPGFVTTTVRFRTVNSTTGCVSAGLNRSVNFYPPATSAAGLDAAICYNGSHNLNGTIGGGATTGTWTANVAGGSFSPDNTFANALTYTPPVNYSGNITLSLITNNPAGPCGAASDAMVLTVYGPLNTSISGGANVCINGDITLTGSTTGGSGTIVSHDWTVIPGTGNASVTTGASMATLAGTVAGTVTVSYTVTDDAGCIMVTTGTLAVTVDAAPTLSACPDNYVLNTDLDECTHALSWTHLNVLGFLFSCDPITLEVDYGQGNGFGTISPGSPANQTFPLGTSTVMYKLSDGVGNMANCSFDVTVSDNQDPVIASCPVTRNISGCLSDITGPIYSTTSTSSTYAAFSDGTNQGVASDNCSMTVSYQDAATGTCPIVVTRTWTISDGTNSVNCDQTINVTPAAATFEATSDLSIACGAAPVGTVLLYTNGETGVCEISGSAIGSISGGHDECGGSYTETWTFVDDCARTITAARVITVLPAPMAAFASTMNISILCGAAPPVGTSLLYTNNESGACEISGSAIGSISGGHDECGGSYTETWTFVDDCARTITASRVITVMPAPMAAFEATSDISILCGAAPPVGTSLLYTNNESGACEISGSAIGSISGGHDECGGSYTETWTFVDDCARTITASRVITVMPAPMASFETTSDISIACGAAPPVGTSLLYTNNESGACEISGSAIGSISGGHDECGGSYTETWIFVDDCARTITASRVITVMPAPMASFETTSDISIACGAAPPVGTSLLYTNNESGACEISGSAIGSISGGHDECGGSYTETWTFVDDCSRTITASRVIAVMPAPTASFEATSDISIACGAAPPVGTSLLYTNNESGACEISGSAIGSISGGHDECGGSYTETWTFVDDCARTITASRVIAVMPAPMAAFEATSDISIACGAAPPVGTSLLYTNNESGACEISGSSIGSISGSHDECGGSYTETWTFVDDCSRTITSSRVITVLPAPMAVFETVMNTTISCELVPPTPTIIGYTNGESGDCEISGSVLSVISGNYTTCGDEFTETWTFVDDCMRTISTSRIITVVAPSTVTLDCPIDVTEASCQDQNTINASFAAWLDLFDFNGGCNSVASFDVIPVPPSACGGSVAVTYRVSSDCEMDHTCTRIFSVISDNTNPIFPKPANKTVNTAGGASCPSPASISLVVNQTTPVAVGNAPFTFTVHGVTQNGPTVYSDNCASGSDLKLFVWNINYNLGGTANDCQRVIRVQWRVYDACGNFQSRNQDFTMLENSAPVLVNPLTTCSSLDITGVDECLSIASAFDAGTLIPSVKALYTDNCDNDLTVTWTNTTPGTNNDCAWSFEYEYTIVDNCGNPTTCTVLRSGGDQTVLTLSCPSDATEPACQDQTAIDLAFSNWISMFDFTGGCTAMAAFDEVYTAPPACGGSVVVIYRATDCFGEQVCSATFIVANNQAPVPPADPTDLSFQCLSDVPAAGVLSAMDACDGVITVTGVDSDNGGSGCADNPRIITRTWTFENSCGNTS